MNMVCFLYDHTHWELFSGNICSTINCDMLYCLKPPRRTKQFLPLNLSINRHSCEVSLSCFLIPYLSTQCVQVFNQLAERHIQVAAIQAPLEAGVTRAAPFPLNYQNIPKYSKSSRVVFITRLFIGKVYPLSQNNGTLKALPAIQSCFMAGAW